LGWEFHGSEDHFGADPYLEEELVGRQVPVMDCWLVVLAMLSLLASVTRLLLQLSVLHAWPWPQPHAS
jgi:hypothetical protein